MPPTEAIAYTRNGSFEPTPDGYVIDTTGAKLQLLPVDADGNVTNNTLAEAFDLQLPTGAPSDPTSALVNVSIGLDGLVTATFANGEGQTLGKVAMATFPPMSGLRPTGDAHWQSTGERGPPRSEERRVGTGCVSTSRSR